MALYIDYIMYIMSSGTTNKTLMIACHPHSVSSDAEDKCKSLEEAIQQQQMYDNQVAECKERLADFQAVVTSLDRPICLHPEEVQEQLNDYKVSTTILYCGGMYSLEDR